MNALCAGMCHGRTKSGAVNAMTSQTSNGERQVKKLDSLNGRCDLKEEGSWGEQKIGTHEWYMDLYVDGDRGLIEWDIPSADAFEAIGLTFDGKRVVDYDGVFSINKYALELLRRNGYDVEDIR